MLAEESAQIYSHVVSSCLSAFDEHKGIPLQSHCLHVVFDGRVVGNKERKHVFVVIFLFIVRLNLLVLCVPIFASRVRLVGRSRKATYRAKPHRIALSDPTRALIADLTCSGRK
jgi:hypothetical protein